MGQASTVSSQAEREDAPTAKGASCLWPHSTSDEPVPQQPQSSRSPRSAADEVGMKEGETDRGHLDAQKHLELQNSAWAVDSESRRTASCFLPRFSSLETCCEEAIAVCPASPGVGREPHASCTSLTAAWPSLKDDNAQDKAILLEPLRSRECFSIQNTVEQLSVKKRRR